MTKKNRSSRSPRGFTLLEVLIAVLILGIIATAVVPLLGSYTEKAREARAEANMLVKAQAIDRYEKDHKAPLGTIYNPSDDTIGTYGLDTMQGPSAQLLLPTDVNGYVLGDGTAAGPYSYGPYLAQLPPEPASMLLGLGTPASIRPMEAQDVDFIWIVTGAAGSSAAFNIQAGAVARKLTPAFPGVYANKAVADGNQIMTVPVTNIDGPKLVAWVNGDEGALSKDDTAILLATAQRAVKQAQTLVQRPRKWYSGAEYTDPLSAAVAYAGEVKAIGEEVNGHIGNFVPLAKFEQAHEFLQNGAFTNMVDAASYFQGQRAELAERARRKQTDAQLKILDGMYDKWHVLDLMRKQVENVEPLSNQDVPELKRMALLAAEEKRKGKAHELRTDAESNFDAAAKLLSKDLEGVGVIATDRQAIERFLQGAMTAHFADGEAAGEDYRARLTEFMWKTGKAARGPEGLALDFNTSGLQPSASIGTTDWQRLMEGTLDKGDYAAKLDGKLTIDNANWKSTLAAEYGQPVKEIEGVLTDKVKVTIQDAEVAKKRYSSMNYNILVLNDDLETKGKTHADKDIGAIVGYRISNPIVYERIVLALLRHGLKKVVNS